MGIRISVFKTQLDGMIETDTDIIPNDVINRAIKGAVERHSVEFPKLIVDDFSGDGGRYYEIATNLTEWIEGFSRIEQIEYPAATIADDEVPQYLDGDEFDEDYWQNDTRYLYFRNHSPGSSETVRVSYVRPYVWSVSSYSTDVNQAGHGFSVGDYVYLNGSSDWVSSNAKIATHQVSDVADSDNFTAKEIEVDIPNADFFALCDLAASFACRAMATKFSKQMESTFEMDRVSHLTKSSEYAKRANEYYRAYEGQFGLVWRRSAPAGVFVDLDTAPSKRRDWLTHEND